MLPNHAPLVIAEAFSRLAVCHLGGIDLGLGRAPGTGHLTIRALRRDRVETEEDFHREVIELLRLLATAQPGQELIAMPGAGTSVPISPLVSSLFSAQLVPNPACRTPLLRFAPPLLQPATTIAGSSGPRRGSRGLTSSPVYR